MKQMSFSCPVKKNDQGGMNSLTGGFYIQKAPILYPPVSNVLVSVKNFIKKELLSRSRSAAPLCAAAHCNP